MGSLSGIPLATKDVQNALEQTVESLTAEMGWLEQNVPDWTSFHIDVVRSSHKYNS